MWSVRSQRTIQLAPIEAFGQLDHAQHSTDYAGYLVNSFVSTDSLNHLIHPILTLRVQKGMSLSGPAAYPQASHSFVFLS